jgi:Ran GTPase-activating protein (RanGAP) involved in mRNA processing and transport
MQSLMFMKSLTKLQLDLIDLTFAIPMLARGLKSNASIKCLITSRCGLLDEPLGELLGNLPVQIEELRIFGNRCRAKGLAAVTNIVKDKNAQLKLLDLSYQHVTDEEEFDVQWLADAVRNNTKLKTLDLDNDSIDDGHLTHIIAALTKNKTLEELMLNHNKITGTGVAMLASKFGEMKGLKKISMYSNVFDAETTPTTPNPSTGTGATSGKNASPKPASSTTSTSSNGH